MKTFITAFVLLAIILGSLTGTAFILMNRPTGNIDISGVEFQIKKGDSPHSVASRLEISGYIKSKLLFIGIVRLGKLENRLKPGWIILKPNSTTIDVMKAVFNGNFVTQTFTIPEGYTNEQVLELLIAEKIVDREDAEAFLAREDYLGQLGLAGFKSSEGFLFPETYKVYKGSSAKTIYKTMSSLFFKKLESVYPDYKSLSSDELYTRLILASIIEKEVASRDEAKRVSGVFYNRMRQGIKLQSCATIQYILKKPKEHLLESDLLLVHPYNTYLNYGLPPGPICNPGSEALSAAFYPEQHNYLYFVVKNPAKGTHHFSETYAEHLRARDRYKALKGFY